MNIISGWNRRVFGNIFDRKFRSLAGIQRALSTRRSKYLLDLEFKVKFELNETLVQEESLWRHKSRISWLHERERNTQFFHLSVLNRRRRNQNIQLKNNLVQWCMEPAALKQMAQVFYETLYISGGPQEIDSQSWNFSPVWDTDCRQLNDTITEAEIKKALF